MDKELDESIDHIDDEMDYARNTLDYSEGYSGKKNAAGIPKVTVYVLIGVSAAYVIIRIWRAWKKSREHNLRIKQIFRGHDGLPSCRNNWHGNKSGI